MFARLQKVELFLDLDAYRKIPDEHMKDPKRCYHEWFQAIGGLENPRKYCRVTVSNIAFSNRPYETNDLIQTSLYSQFLEACKNFVGFQTVILELGSGPPFSFNRHSQESYYQAATGPAQDPIYAGGPFEALKLRLAMELEPSLGSCIYYDRGNFRCLEFRPRDTVNVIEPGQKPFIDPMDG